MRFLTISRAIGSILAIPFFLTLPSCHSDNPTLPPTTGSIDGYVYDASASNQPLPGASVTTVPITSTVITGLNGDYSIRDVNPGIYQVIANKAGYRSDTAVVPVAAGKMITASFSLGLETVAVPASPSHLTATATTPCQIILNWIDESNNESGFRIYRQQSGQGTWLQIATVAMNSNSFLDTGLNSFSEYSYVLRAYNSGGNSGSSNMATDTTFLPFNVQASGVTLIPT